MPGKTAIVVPVKDRDEYLDVFLDRVPRYLDDVNQMESHHIVVAEQTSAGLFSAGLAKNVGAIYAIQELGCDRLVFNDVDMIPIENVDYRDHGQETICFMNFGSCKVSADAFLRANGFNPEIFGWGHEDSDFYNRLETFEYDCVRWDRSREYDHAVVMDLELRRETAEEELEFSRSYWRRDVDKGSLFVSPDAPLEHYDKHRDWYSEEQKRKNRVFVEAAYNQNRSSRIAAYASHGANLVGLEACLIRESNRRAHIKYDVAEVLAGTGGGREGRVAPRNPTFSAPDSEEPLSEPWLRRRWIEVTTTVGCAVRCSYCPQERFVKSYTRGGKLSTMSLETFGRCIEKLPSDVAILFAGFSEPWLNPQCSEMVRLASRAGFRVDAYTTCVGMTPEDVHSLAAVELGSLYIHLPNDREDFDRVVSGSEYFEVLETLVRSGIRNVEYHFHRSAEHAEALHPRVAEIVEAQPTSVPAWQLQSRAGNLIGSIVSAPTRKTGRLRCSQGRLHKNILFPNGDVTLCCMDWQIEHKLGNLLESEYEAILCGRELANIKRGLENDESEILCRNCEWAEEIR